jgi:arylsulfatase
MVDDMGFTDVGSYGGEIDTPNIDALAKQACASAISASP